MTQAELDYAFLKLAYSYAAAHSPDPSTQNAALLVSDLKPASLYVSPPLSVVRDKIKGHRMLISCNEPAEGITLDPLNPLKKNDYMVHAETNVIYLAARTGFTTYGSVMYCPWFACSHCADAIIQAGIKEVVGHNSDLHYLRKDWAKTVELGEEKLRQAGVVCRRLNAFFDVSLKFSGQVVKM